MRFDVLTIFPELFDPFRSTGVLGRAVARGTVEVEVHDLRAWASTAGSRWTTSPTAAARGW